MNGIILYGSRYGASQQYAQALEGRTGLPAVSYNEIKDFSPFDTIVYIGGVYAGRTVGLAKTVRRLPTDHPFRLLVATVGLSDPSNEDSMLNIREHLAEELTPAIFIRTAHVHLRGAMDYSILQHRHQGEEDIQHLQDLFQQQRLRREGVKQQLEKGRQLAVLVLGQHQHGQQGRQHHCDHQDAHDPGRGQDVRVISIVVHLKPFFLSFIPIGWRTELPLFQGFRPV